MTAAVVGKNEKKERENNYRQRKNRSNVGKNSENESRECIYIYIICTYGYIYIYIYGCKLIKQPLKVQADRSSSREKKKREQLQTFYSVREIAGMHMGNACIYFLKRNHVRVIIIIIFLKLKKKPKKYIYMLYSCIYI